MDNLSLLLLLTFCGSWVTAENLNTLIAASAKGDNMDLAPDPSMSIGTKNVDRIEKCLILCLTTDECLAVVFDGSICTLHNTKYGTHRLTSGQKAVAMESKFTERGIFKLNIYSNRYSICVKTLDEVI